MFVLFLCSRYLVISQETKKDMKITCSSDCCNRGCSFCSTFYWLEFWLKILYLFEIQWLVLNDLIILVGMTLCLSVRISKNKVRCMLISANETTIFKHKLLIFITLGQFKLMLTYHYLRKQLLKLYQSHYEAYDNEHF